MTHLELLHEFIMYKLIAKEYHVVRDNLCLYEPHEIVELLEYMKSHLTSEQLKHITMEMIYNE